MDVDDSDRIQIAAIVLSLVVLVGAIGTVLIAVGGDFGERASSTDAATIGDLRETGVTGENVSVGVVVATGVDPTRSSLTEQVVAARTFGGRDAIANGGDNRHGTATAAVVARVAPEADLYLASFDDASGFEGAMTWLRREAVDVVVAPVSFYGRPGDGSSRVARSASATVANGSVVVAPVGNVGTGHWEGAFDPTANGTHRFAGGPRNYLRATGDRTLALWLSWQGPPAGGGPAANRSRNFSVELHRQTGTRSRFVARSRPYGGDRPIEGLTTELAPGGTYYVVVDGPATAAGTHLEIASPTHAFQYRERGGSVVAPAAARPVVAVGAADPETGDPRPYSSAGPVAGTRPGVDVIAVDRRPVPVVDGDFRGTSAASAYTAGVVALMLDAEPTLTPKEVEAILEATAVDAGPEGVDPVAGHGRLVTEHAIERARNVST
jgi:hypothetical protein